METEAIDNQANLVNYDNENEYEIEDLGYESEEYNEDAHEDDENNHSNGYAKRGITRISGKHRALFLSFLGDMVREHIGLQILSSKKVGPEARNKLWDEITQYFDVDLTVRKLVMNRLGQLLRNFRRKLRQTYILPNQDTPSKLNDCPADKETEDNIKEGTLQVDQPTDAMTLVLGKEKGGYARGVGSGVTYKRYFDLPRSKQVADERICTDPIDSRKLLNCWELRERSRSIKRILQVKINNPKKMCRPWLIRKQLVLLEGSVYKSDGKRMIHKKASSKDLIQSGFDKNPRDASFIPDVGNDRVTTVLDCSSPHITLNALSGLNSYQTMRIRGIIGKQEIHILIDCGSTHNFLIIHTAKKTTPMQVLVANGQRMLSNSVCHDLKWSLQIEVFTSDVMLLPLGGCEMVLGI
ncbi:hypothetical protein Tco_1125658 [Tanacetum coccineum]|uniref:Uncharacterized protein n=1 Tax=Tanacetum coccineum TaxID=301880 RepID=A0ABQ5JCK0_9ASTR